jgi:hypothetical protein
MNIYNIENIEYNSLRDKYGKVFKNMNFVQMYPFQDSVFQTKCKLTKQSNKWYVAHSCNTSYSGSRDWEDHGSRPVQEKS